MKRIKNTLVASSLFCLMIVSTVLADDMKHHQTVTFDKAVMINNTLLKEGTYRVTFDVQNNQVKFRKTSNGDVVLVAPASVETMAKKAEYDAVTLAETAAGTTVQKLVFEGHREAAILNTVTAAVSMTHKQVPTNNNFSMQDWDWYYQAMNSNGMNSNGAGITTEESFEEEMYRD